MEYSKCMTDQQTLLSFFDALVRCETELWNTADAHGRAAGGPALGSLSALRIIDRYDGSARVQEVADDLIITVGAASKIVDRLVRDGLALRLPHPVDRRSSLLALTDGGAATLQAGVASLTEALRDAIGDAVDPAELASIAHVLRRLATR